MSLSVHSPAAEAGKGMLRVVFYSAILFSVFQLVTSAFSPLSSTVVRALHVGFLLLLTFLLHPWKGGQGRTSVLFCYAFGKAQRILAGLDPAIGPIICHGAAQALTQVYRESGVALPATVMVGDVTDKAALKTAMVIAPPSICSGAA